MLRFKNDDGSEFPEWEEKNFLDCISQIVDFRGRTPLKLGTNWNEEKSEYLALSALNVKNGYIDDTIDAHYGNEELYNIWMKGNELYKGQVLFTTEAPMGNVAQVPDDKPYILSQRTVAFVPDYTLLQDDFLAVLLSSSNVQKKLDVLATGGTAKGVSQKSLKSLGVKLPSLPEQQKIAEFLSTIDTVIEKQKKTVSAWEERKKGMMQKLFSQEVRFKADDGSDFPEWEEKKLSEMFKKVIEKNRLDLPPLTIVQGYGTIRRDESERRIAYDEKGLKNYKAVQKDDFIVHLRSFEGGLEIANQDGIVSPAYHVYRGNDEVHPSFYYPYFRSSSFIKGKLSICVTGVRDGKNIEMGSFDELLVPHPCLAEQQKIADCLSSLDEVIEKQKATLAAWEELKKGLLQQMFV